MKFEKKKISKCSLAKQKPKNEKDLHKTNKTNGLRNNKQCKRLKQNK